jgi:integrase
VGARPRHIDVSPAARLKLPLNEADPQPYTDSELGALVEAASKAEEPWRTLYLLVAYTGQRPATWTDAKWTEIDLRNATLTVGPPPGAHHEARPGLVHPARRPAVALVQALHRRQGRGRNEWLFGRKLVVEQKVRDRIAEAAGMAKEGERGTLQRFRATMLTKFNRWRVPTEIQQRMAGHANPFEGSRAHYIPAPPTPEMHELAARYAEHVRMCLLV